MAEEKEIERARRDKEEGKSPSTQAGEFVREEMHHIREGKHGAQSPQQAIAIGLSKARRAGVELPPPKRGASSKTRAAKRFPAFSRDMGSAEAGRKFGGTAREPVETCTRRGSPTRKAGSPSVLHESGSHRAASKAVRTPRG
jgi:hypothetical protein